jgi:hypothetical protein
MLYVPLFFYVFDRLKERGEKRREAAAPGAAATAAPHARREDD